MCVGDRYLTRYSEWFSCQLGNWVCIPVVEKLTATDGRRRRHNADLDHSIIMVPTFKHWYAYQLVYPWALLFVKASILALYYRIFTQTNFRYAVYAVSIFVTVQTIVVTFVNVRHTRNPSIPPSSKLSDPGFRMRCERAMESMGPYLPQRMQRPS
jgi:hypothetical protein